jgi:hypothetical protein
MAQADPFTRDRLQEERELRVRIGLGVKMLTNAGYALIGGTFFRAVTEHREISLLSYLCGATGLALLGFALYFSPSGEAGDA